MLRNTIQNHTKIIRLINKIISSSPTKPLHPAPFLNAQKWTFTGPHQTFRVLKLLRNQVHSSFGIYQRQCDLCHSTLCIWKLALCLDGRASFVVWLTQLQRNNTTKAPQRQVKTMCYHLTQTPDHGSLHKMPSIPMGSFILNIKTLLSYTENGTHGGLVLWVM